VAHCGLGLGEREAIATCRQGHEVAALPDERTSILDLEALAPYGYAKEHFGYRDRLSVPTIEDVLSDPGRVEIDFDGALRYRARAPTPVASFGADRAPLNQRSPPSVGFCPFAIPTPYRACVCDCAAGSPASTTATVAGRPPSKPSLPCTG
jgi:hypothetical protein